MDDHEISRRGFLKTGSTLALGAMAPETQATDPGKLSPTGRNKPNLIFVFADQWRAQTLGCMGNTQVITPNLDRFAGEGMMLENAISTYPLCTPYRAMMLTGRYPLATGMVTNDLLLPLEEITIGEVLRDAGYRTGYVGKWHLDGADRGIFTPPGPRRHGFEYWRVCNCDHRYFNAFYYADTPERKYIEGYEPDAQTDMAIEFINQNRQNPFFLVLSWGPPHDPYIAPKKFFDMYDPAAIELRKNVTCANKNELANYYAACTALDWNFGRLLETLRNTGLEDNTIVVFTSDHGDMLYSLDLKLKDWPYEESIHVPFLIRYPGTIPTASKSDVLLGTPDIMPTLLSLCGVPSPTGVQGTDLSARLRGEKMPDPSSVIIMNVRPLGYYYQRLGQDTWRGVRTKRYTYARFRERDWGLYDNQEDLYQLRNLTAEAEFAAIKHQCENELQVWLKRINDPFPPANTFPIVKYIDVQPVKK